MKYRLPEIGCYWEQGHLPGVMAFKHTMTQMAVIISEQTEQDGKNWLHVSMSYRDKMPDYHDLLKVKNTFIGEDKDAVMVLPKEKDKVNHHPYTLHLFHCLSKDITPSILPDFTGGRGIL